jgi:hypothetical protein
VGSFFLGLTAPDVVGDKIQLPVVLDDDSQVLVLETAVLAHLGEGW